jgi:uncharacterized RDD family membrane protein YckC
MFCVKCGSAVEKYAEFCPACNHRVVVVGAPITPAMPWIAAPVATGPLAFPYAGFWLRVVAYLIDGAVMSIPFGAVVLAVVLLLGGVSYLQGVAAGLNGPNPDFPPALILAFLAMFAAILAVTWLYYAFMESSSHQGTLGKMALGLIVTDTAGRRISFGRASGRFFAKMITGMVPLGIGYIMAGFTEKKQALHDMIASCLVFKKT